jgi:hypothetical protein
VRDRVVERAAAHDERRAADGGADDELRRLSAELGKQRMDRDRDAGKRPGCGERPRPSATSAGWRNTGRRSARISASHGRSQR